MNQKSIENRPNQFGLRTGFTLVELLVVITIIGILAGLVMFAVGGAMGTANEAAIRTELTSLDAAFVKYGNDISGNTYPPNLANAKMADGNGGATNMPNNLRAGILAQFKRHLNAAFPKHQEPDELIEKICGCTSNGSTRVDGLIGGLSPQEALVFWLGGFSSDPKYPISGPGGPSFRAGEAEDWSSRTGRLFDFQEANLGPRDDAGNFGGRQFEYTVNGQKRYINFWQYFPRRRTQAYAYFDTSRAPLDGLPIDVFPQLVPIKQKKSSVLDPSNLKVGDIRYANEGKCQLLSAGVDDEWGPFLSTQGVNFTNKAASAPLLLLYPDGPFTEAIGDTVTNFSTGASLEDSQP
jgi:prepilin-type N-terminal cleavage/methylation domain-containing protein